MTHKYLLFLLLLLTSQIFCIDKSKQTDLGLISSLINNIDTLETELNKNNYESIYKKLNNCFKVVLKRCNKEQRQKITQYTASIMEKITKFQLKEKRQRDKLTTLILNANKFKIDLTSIELDQDFQEDKKETEDEVITNNFLDYLYSLKVELEHFIDLVDFVKSHDFIKFRLQMEKNARDNLLDERFNLSCLKSIFVPLNISKLKENYEEKRKTFIRDINYIILKNKNLQLPILNFNLKKIKYLNSKIPSLVKKAIRGNLWMQHIKFELRLDT